MQPNPAAAATQPSLAAGPAGRAGVPAWFGWGGLVVVALLGAVSSGVSGFFSLAGVYLFVVAVIALVRGRVSWARLRSRAAGAGTLGVALALTAVGGATATPTEPAPAAVPPVTRSASATPTPSTTASPTRSPTPTVAPTPTKAAASPATAAKGTAPAAVAKLTVKGRAPKTGYSRDQFGQAWFDTDRNGCDTRNDMLRRDLVSKDMKNWCKVLAGCRRTSPSAASMSLGRSPGS